jgi:subtilisin-like proprotein convertase family protein
MKRILTLAIAMAMGAAAQGQYVFNSTNSAINEAIPDNNPSGLASTITVPTLTAAINNVTVSLDLTGGYNGDLYAYLAGPNGGFAVLLNRAGMSGTSAYGYSDSGFNVTFDDSGSNPDIHFYQTDSPIYSGGQLTGTWGSDGENLNPQGAPGGFPVSPTETLTSFDGINGSDAAGQWTLFLADLAAGNQSTLVSWSLEIMTVPEPSTLALGALGIGLLVARKMGRRKCPAC